MTNEEKYEQFDKLRQQYLKELKELRDTYLKKFIELFKESQSE